MACKHGSTSVICPQCDLDVIKDNEQKMADELDAEQYIKVQRIAAYNPSVKALLDVLLQKDKTVEAARKCVLEHDALRAENERLRNKLATWDPIALRDSRIGELESELAALRAVPQDEEVQRMIEDMHGHGAEYPICDQAADLLESLSRALAAVKTRASYATAMQNHAQADLAASAARVEANAKDAARYRWLRSSPTDGHVRAAFAKGYTYLDEIIDAALAQAQPEPHGKT